MGLIIVTSIIKTPINKVWNYWIRTNHITKWNFASNDWYCPKADNNLLVGGEFQKMGWQSILDNFKNYVANQED